MIFSTCKLQVKRVHYWDEIHGNREEYIHGRRCDKGYDGGFPGKTDTGIFYPYAVRAAVPAAVQYGGHHHRGQVPGG